ncbi:hypothetical protein NUW58_g859 [Xylaria curta]|uniref:Uncharacterized protein n=1 Tax=Xylaria curta TaxID=42375 RepID=A0ACC1PPQ6_9PEZI|nr:hypothetical protein NUW58_g859 [Xylaria curta]
MGYTLKVTNRSRKGLKGLPPTIELPDDATVDASAFPLATAVLHSTPADVDTVMVDGKIRKRDGHLVGQDVQDIRERAKAGLQRIMANLSQKRAEMTSDEVRQYVLNVERLTRANLAKAYSEEASTCDPFRNDLPGS